MKTEREEERSEKKESEDWCFICKDGGELYICDRLDCTKAYEKACLNEMNLPVPVGERSWHCSRHTCSKCNAPSTFYCYCCPTSACQDCVVFTNFVLDKNQHGFCKECWFDALHFEKKKRDLKRLGRRMRLFGEYYEIVKKDVGFSLKNIQSQQERLKRKQIHISNNYDSVEGPERAPKFASIVSENIKLVYLKQSVIMKLLKEEPESFESKVKGSYVRAPSAPSNGHQRRSYQLVQVTGVVKASSGQDRDIKLRLLDIPNDICIELLSDGTFTEEECKDLRHKMNVGLLKKPTLDEFKEKARNLQKDMYNQRLVELQSRINFAMEKGWRSRLYALLEERTMLEKPAYRLHLLNSPPKVIPEPSNELKDASDIVSISDDTDDEKKTNKSRIFITVDNECNGNKTAAEKPEYYMNSEESEKDSEKRETKSKSAHRKEVGKTKAKSRIVPWSCCEAEKQVSKKRKMEAPIEKEKPSSSKKTVQVVDSAMIWEKFEEAATYRHKLYLKECRACFEQFLKEIQPNVQ